MHSTITHFRALLTTLFLAVMLPVLGHAQTETEPNNNFTQANPVAFATNITGTGICSGDGEDYFRVVLPAGNKSLRLIVSGSMVSGSGNMYIYLYNKYQQQLDNKYLSWTTITKTDTLDYTCFEGDTVYVRLLHWVGACRNYSVRVENTNQFTLANDAEQNDNFATAQGLIFQKDTTGHLGSQRYGTGPYTDNEDYYRCVLPAGGKKTLRLITTAKSVPPNSSGTFYVYFYNKYQQQLSNNYVSFANSNTIDTMDFPCFEGDTFFVRIYNWSGPCKEYRIRAEYTNEYTLDNDAEPNDVFTTAIDLPFQKDTTGHLGSQRAIGSSPTTDNEDYYRVVLPPGGTKSLRLITCVRSVPKSTTGTMYVYLYNKYQQQLTNSYISFSNTAKTDTLDYTCFEGDTFYVRIYNWSGPCKEYRIRTDYTGEFSLQNDTETNDDFTNAASLPFQKDTTGHLGSQRAIGSPTTDNEDYYRVVLPPGGTKSLRLITYVRSVPKSTTGTMYVYLYNKYQQQLTNSYISFSNTAKTDTLDYTCFEGDTFYVRIYNWSGPCKEYRIRTDYTNQFTVQNDIEPNESIATARPIDFKQIVTGHLGSQVYGATSPRTDNDDYYRCILPNNGKGIKIIMKARSVQPGTSGTFYYYLYGKAGNQILNRYVSFTDTMRADTLEYNCYQPDTFYIRVYNWSGACKEYSFHTTQSTTGPIAFDISHTRFGNDFSFMNTTRNAKTFRWNFGDGKTDTVAAPTHTYSIGKFITTLNATNICGTRAFRDTIEVDGVEYYTPKRAGSENGLGIFAIRVFGGGLDTNLKFTLKKGGTTYTPVRVSSPQSREATISYNFKTLPIGTYDIEIKFPGGQTYNYPAGFEIYTDTPGFNITTEIISPARVRTGRLNSYAIKIVNHKGRIANGVRAFIVLPRGMKNDIHKILWKPKGKIELAGTTYDKLTIDPDIYKSLYYGGDFDPNRDVFTVDQDKLYAAMDSANIAYDIDSLFGRPFRGTVYPIYVPLVKANGSHTISFSAGTPANGDFTVASFVQPWTVRQNPVSGQTLDYIHEGGMQAAALAEYAPNPALKAVGKSAAYVDIGSQVAFTEFFDWYYGVNNADEAFYAKQGLSLVANEAGNRLPFGKKADDYAEAGAAARRRMGRQTESMMLEDQIAQTIKDPRLRNVMSDRIQDLQDAIRRNSDLVTQADKEVFINNFLNWSAKQGINLTQKQVENLLFPKEIKEKKTQSLASYDPNEIFGPDGPGKENYIRRDDELPYEVTFENYDTALVPAQIVRVNVSLDTAKFDIRRTTLGAVRFGGKLYQFEEDRAEYFRDIDLRPAKNMIVRVNAKTDTLSGMLYWEFLSLDPVTKNLIDDVLDGFLPPNKNSPEGEGAVTFTTHLKPGMRNRDSVSAFATIYFDENEPILTPKWINTVDEGIPTSTLNPTIQVADSSMRLVTTGNDGESGFREYRLYVKQGDSAWKKEPYIMNDVTGNLVIGKPGETYSFYVEGRDSVGIWEKKQQQAEATVTIPKTGPPVQPNAIGVFPNPAKNSITVRTNSAQGGAIRITITSLTGQLAASFEGQQAAGTSDYRLSTEGFQSGVFFVEVLINGSSLAKEKLVILR